MILNGRKFKTCWIKRETLEHIMKKCVEMKEANIIKQGKKEIK